MFRIFHKFYSPFPPLRLWPFGLLSLSFLYPSLFAFPKYFLFFHSLLSFSISLSLSLSLSLFSLLGKCTYLILLLKPTCKYNLHLFVFYLFIFPYTLRARSSLFLSVSAQAAFPLFTLSSHSLPHTLSHIIVSLSLSLYLPFSLSLSLPPSNFHRIRTLI